MPTSSIWIYLTNGEELEVTPIRYTPVRAITEATEWTSYGDVTAFIRDVDGSEVAVPIFACIVTNPVTKVERYTDPNPITVSSNGTISAANLSGGQLLATYTNGKTGAVDISSYTLGSNAYINDTSRSKQVAVTATYSSSYSTSQSITVYAILLNNPASATLKITSDTILRPYGVTPNHTLTANHPNGAKSTISSSCYTMDKIYKTGTTTDSDSWASTQGDCTVYAKSIKIGTGTTYWRYQNGVEKTYTTPQPTISNASASAHWLDNPTEVTLADGPYTVYARDYSHSTVTPSVGKKLSVKWTSGYVGDYEPTTTDAVQNIRDNTTSATHEFKVYFACNGIEKEDTGTCEVLNPAVKLEAYYATKTGGVKDIESNTSGSYLDYPALHYTGYPTSGHMPTAQNTRNMLKATTGLDGVQCSFELRAVFVNGYRVTIPVSTYDLTADKTTKVDGTSFGPLILDGLSWSEGIARRTAHLVTATCSVNGESMSLPFYVTCVNAEMRFVEDILDTYPKQKLYRWGNGAEHYERI